MTSPSSGAPAGHSQTPTAGGLGPKAQPQDEGQFKEAIVFPVSFPDASKAPVGEDPNSDAEDGGADCGAGHAGHLVQLLEFRSLSNHAGRNSHAVRPTAPAAAAPAPAPEPATQLIEEIAALESRLRMQEQSARQQIERARAEGRMEGQRSAEQEAERSVAAEREQVAGLVERFRAEHEQYFRRVEREVVRLALAIAARVLHREANVDPLLLAGVVRVALEKLADTSGLVLRTSPGEVVAWQEMFRLTGEARIHPDVVGDLALRPGDCILETRLGTVELGVRAQLEEIENGFFDLLNQKPKRGGARK